MSGRVERCQSHSSAWRRLFCGQIHKELPRCLPHFFAASSKTTMAGGSSSGLREAIPTRRAGPPSFVPQTCWVAGGFPPVLALSLLARAVTGWTVKGAWSVFRLDRVLGDDHANRGMLMVPSAAHCCGPPRRKYRSLAQIGSYALLRRGSYTRMYERREEYLHPQDSVRRIEPTVTLAR